MPATCVRSRSRILGMRPARFCSSSSASVLGVFDALVLSPASLVLGDDVVAVEQAYLCVARDERERDPAARVPMRCRVVIGAKADEGRRVDAGGRHEVGLRQRGRQREKSLLLLGETSETVRSRKRG